MPRAYFQCPRCKQTMSTRYQTSDGAPPEMFCCCRDLPKGGRTPMTYRGDGWDGRLNFPHGRRSGCKAADAAKE